MGNKLQFFSRWRQRGRARTFELSVWAAEHPLEVASVAGIAGLLLGAAAFYVKQQRRKKQG